MTIPRKGRHLVRVGEHEYAWRIRKKSTQGAFQAPMRVAIQRSEPRSGGVLIANLVVSRPNNWISPHQTAVTPASIRDIIARGIDAEWDPASTASFTLEYGLVRDKA